MSCLLLLAIKQGERRETEREKRGQCWFQEESSLSIFLSQRSSSLPLFFIHLFFVFLCVWICALSLSLTLSLSLIFVRSRDESKRKRKEGRGRPMEEEEEDSTPQQRPALVLS